MSNPFDLPPTYSPPSGDPKSPEKGQTIPPTVRKVTLNILRGYLWDQHSDLDGEFLEATDGHYRVFLDTRYTPDSLDGSIDPDERTVTLEELRQCIEDGDYPPEGSALVARRGNILLRLTAIMKDDGDAPDTGKRWCEVSLKQMRAYLWGTNQLAYHGRSLKVTDGDGRDVVLEVTSVPASQDICLGVDERTVTLEEMRNYIGYKDYPPDGIGLVARRGNVILRLSRVSKPQGAPKPPPANTFSPGRIAGIVIMLAYCGLESVLVVNNGPMHIYVIPLVLAILAVVWGFASRQMKGRLMVPFNVVVAIDLVLGVVLFAKSTGPLRYAASAQIALDAMVLLVINLWSKLRK